MKSDRRETVIVTGATGYFGRYFVKALMNQYHVIAIARDRDKLADLNRDCDDQLTVVSMDLNKIENLRQEFEGLLENYSVKGLVNNAFPLGSSAGFNTAQGKLPNIQPNMIMTAYAAGAIAPLLLIQSFGNYLIEKKLTGKIVNISSMYGSVSPDPALYEGKEMFNPVSYGMAKAALEYLTKYVASFWGKHGIRCNAIAPGPFPNIEFSSENATTDEEFLNRLRVRTCNRNVGHPSQLIGTLRLLLSEDAEFINGEVIHVDGGWTVR